MVIQLFSTLYCQVIGTSTKPSSYIMMIDDDLTQSHHLYPHIKNSNPQSQDHRASRSSPQDGYPNPIPFDAYSYPATAVAAQAKNYP